LRCYSCDSMTGANPFVDKRTNRCYCKACWEAITDVLKEKDDRDEDLGVSEVEVDEFSDKFIPEVQTEATWEEFNLPVDNDD
jgi:hypothetical protein